MIMKWWTLASTVNYDHAFNSNEWFILISIAVGYSLLFILPKRFPTTYIVLFLFIGMNSGMVFDHTISIPPFDFYDVNDSSKFEIYDFLSYIMYGPYGYFFFYLYDYLKLRRYRTMLYIISWSIAAMIVEWVAYNLGVFHYKAGYKFIYSFPFYFFVQSVTLALFNLIMKKAPPNK